MRRRHRCSPACGIRLPGDGRLVALSRDRLVFSTASPALPVDDLGGCGERVDVCCVRDAGAVLVGVGEWWGQVPLVADSLGRDHSEADLMLEPLGESPQTAGCSCVLVPRGDAGETREAVRPQPRVFLLQAKCERLTVVALGGGHIARVEMEVAEAV